MLGKLAQPRLPVCQQCVLHPRKLAQKRRRQRAAADGLARFDAKRGRDVAQLLGKLGVRAVDADADDDIVRLHRLRHDRKLCQNARRLPCAEDQIVRPFDAGTHAADRLDRAAGGHGAHGRQMQKLRRVRLRAKQDAEIQAEPAGRIKAPPAPPAAGRLAVGNGGGAVRRALRRKLLEIIVRRVDLLHHMHVLRPRMAVQQGGDALAAERVRREHQPVAPPRRGADLTALLTKLLDGLPDRRAGDPEPAADLLAGELALHALQKLQNLLFHRKTSDFCCVLRAPMHAGGRPAVHGGKNACLLYGSMVYSRL